MSVDPKVCVECNNTQKELKEKQEIFLRFKKKICKIDKLLKLYESTRNELAKSNTLVQELKSKCSSLVSTHRKEQEDAASELAALKFKVNYFRKQKCKISDLQKELESCRSFEANYHQYKEANAVLEAKVDFWHSQAVEFEAKLNHGCVKAVCKSRGTQADIAVASELVEPYHAEKWKNSESQLRTANVEIDRLKGRREKNDTFRQKCSTLETRLRTLEAENVTLRADLHNLSAPDIVDFSCPTSCSSGISSGNATDFEQDAEDLELGVARPTGNSDEDLGSGGAQTTLQALVSVARLTSNLDGDLGSRGTKTARRALIGRETCHEAETVEPLEKGPVRPLLVPSPVQPSRENLVLSSLEDVVQPSKEGVIKPLGGYLGLPLLEDLGLPLLEDLELPLLENLVLPVPENVVQPSQEGIIKPLGEDFRLPLLEDLVLPLQENIVQPLQENIIQPSKEGITKPSGEDVIKPLEEVVIQPSQDDLTQTLGSGLIQPAKNVRENAIIPEKSLPIVDKSSTLASKSAPGDWNEGLDSIRGVAAVESADWPKKKKKNGFTDEEVMKILESFKVPELLSPIAADNRRGTVVTPPRGEGGPVPRTRVTPEARHHPYSGEGRAFPEFALATMQNLLASVNSGQVDGDVKSNVIRDVSKSVRRLVKLYSRSGGRPPHAYPLLAVLPKEELPWTLSEDRLPSSLPGEELPHPSMDELFDASPLVRNSDRVRPRRGPSNDHFVDMSPNPLHCPLIPLEEFPSPISIRKMPFKHTRAGVSPPCQARVLDSIVRRPLSSVGSAEGSKMAFNDVSPPCQVRVPPISLNSSEGSVGSAEGSKMSFNDVSPPCQVRVPPISLNSSEGSGGSAEGSEMSFNDVSPPCQVRVPPISLNSSEGSVGSAEGSEMSFNDVSPPCPVRVPPISLNSSEGSVGSAEGSKMAFNDVSPPCQVRVPPISLNSSEGSVGSAEGSEMSFNDVSPPCQVRVPPISLNSSEGSVGSAEGSEMSFNDVSPPCQVRVPPISLNSSEGSVGSAEGSKMAFNDVSPPYQARVPPISLNSSEGSVGSAEGSKMAFNDVSPPYQARVPPISLNSSEGSVGSAEGSEMSFNDVSPPCQVRVPPISLNSSEGSVGSAEGSKMAFNDVSPPCQVRVPPISLNSSEGSVGSAEGSEMSFNDVSPPYQVRVPPISLNSSEGSGGSAEGSEMSFNDVSPPCQVRVPPISLNSSEGSVGSAEGSKMAFNDVSPPCQVRVPPISLNSSEGSVGSAEGSKMSFNDVSPPCPVRVPPISLNSSEGSVGSAEGSEMSFNDVSPPCPVRVPPISLNSSEGSVGSAEGSEMSFNDVSPPCPVRVPPISLNSSEGSVGSAEGSKMAFNDVSPPCQVRVPPISLNSSEGSVGSAEGSEMSFNDVSPPCQVRVPPISLNSSEGSVGSAEGSTMAFNDVSPPYQSRVPPISLNSSEGSVGSAEGSEMSFNDVSPPCQVRVPPISLNSSEGSVGSAEGSKMAFNDVSPPYQARVPPISLNSSEGSVGSAEGSKMAFNDVSPPYQARVPPISLNSSEGSVGSAEGSKMAFNDVSPPCQARVPPISLDSSEGSVGSAVDCLHDKMSFKEMRAGVCRASTVVPPLSSVGSTKGSLQDLADQLRMSDDSDEDLCETAALEQPLSGAKTKSRKGKGLRAKLLKIAKTRKIATIPSPSSRVNGKQKRAKTPAGATRKNASGVGKCSEIPAIVPAKSADEMSAIVRASLLERQRKSSPVVPEMSREETLLERQGKSSPVVPATSQEETTAIVPAMSREETLLESQGKSSPIVPEMSQEETLLEGQAKSSPIVPAISQEEQVALIPTTLLKRKGKSSPIVPAISREEKLALIPTTLLKRQRKSFPIVSALSQEETLLERQGKSSPVVPATSQNETTAEVLLERQRKWPSLVPATILASRRNSCPMAMAKARKEASTAVPPTAFRRQRKTPIVVPATMSESRQESSPVVPTRSLEETSDVVPVPLPETRGEEEEGEETRVLEPTAAKGGENAGQALTMSCLATGRKCHTKRLATGKTFPSLSESFVRSTDETSPPPRVPTPLGGASLGEAIAPSMEGIQPSSSASLPSLEGSEVPVPNRVLAMSQEEKLALIPTTLLKRPRKSLPIVSALSQEETLLERQGKSSPVVPATSQNETTAEVAAYLLERQRKWPSLVPATILASRRNSCPMAMAKARKEASTAFRRQRKTPIVVPATISESRQESSPVVPTGSLEETSDVVPVPLPETRVLEPTAAKGGENAGRALTMSCLATGRKCHTKRLATGKTFPSLSESFVRSTDENSPPPRVPTPLGGGGASLGEEIAPSMEGIQPPSSASLPSLEGSEVPVPNRVLAAEDAEAPQDIERAEFPGPDECLIQRVRAPTETTLSDENSVCSLSPPTRDSPDLGLDIGENKVLTSRGLEPKIADCVPRPTPEGSMTSPVVGECPTSPPVERPDSPLSTSSKRPTGDTSPNRGAPSSPPPCLAASPSSEDFALVMSPLGTSEGSVTSPVVGECTTSPPVERPDSPLSTSSKRPTGDTSPNRGAPSSPPPCLAASPSSQDFALVMSPLDSEESSSDDEVEPPSPKAGAQHSPHSSVDNLGSLLSAGPSKTLKKPPTVAAPSPSSPRRVVRKRTMTLSDSEGSVVSISPPKRPPPTFTMNYYIEAPSPPPPPSPRPDIPVKEPPGYWTSPVEEPPEDWTPAPGYLIMRCHKMYRKRRRGGGRNNALPSKTKVTKKIRRAAKVAVDRLVELEKYHVLDPKGERVLTEIVTGLGKVPSLTIIEHLLTLIAEDKAEEDSEYSPPAPPLTPSQRHAVVLAWALHFERADFVTELCAKLQSSILRLSKGGPELSVLLRYTRVLVALCIAKRDLLQLRTFMFDALYCFKNKCYQLCQVVIALAPGVIPMSFKARDDILVQTIVYLLSAPRPDGYRSLQICRNQLKGLLATSYKYNNAHKMTLAQIMTRIDVDLKAGRLAGIEPAVTLLGKRISQQWTQQNLVVPFFRLLPTRTKDSVKMKLPVSSTRLIVKLLSLIARTVPKSDMLRYHSIFCKMSELLTIGHADTEESAAMALVRMSSRAPHYTNIVDCLFQWCPRREPSKQLLSRVVVFMNKKSPVFWRKYLQNHGGPRT